MNLIESVYPEIAEIIKRKYFDLRVLLMKDSYDDEYFISINDSDVYNSEEFQELILDLKQKFIWANNLTNVFFIIENKETVKSIDVSWKIDTLSEYQDISKPTLFHQNIFKPDMSNTLPIAA